MPYVCARCAPSSAPVKLTKCEYIKNRGGTAFHAAQISVKHSKLTIIHKNAHADENDDWLTIVFIHICHTHTHTSNLHTILHHHQRRSQHLLACCAVLLSLWCACMLNKYHSFYFEIYVILLSRSLLCLCACVCACVHILKTSVFSLWKRCGSRKKNIHNVCVLA